MLSVFRNNLFTTAFTLAIYVALLHLPALMGWVKPAEGAVAGGGLLYESCFGWAANAPFLSALAAMLLVFAQALAVNYLADAYRLMNDRNWIPGALYALVASCIPDFLFISPALVGVTMLPLALFRLFGVYRQALAFALVFDVAFWLTVGCLFYPPMAWLLPASYFGLFNLRSFQVREQVVYFTGIFVPMFLAWVAYFWTDRAAAFWYGQFSDGLGFDLLRLDVQLKTALLLMLVVVALLGFNVYYHKRLIQVQKYVSIFYWFMFAGLAILALHSGAHREVFVLLMPSIAIFLSFSFQSIRNAFIAEVFHFTLLAMVLFIQYFPQSTS